MRANWNERKAILVSSTTLNRVKTPCIGVCSTGIGDSVCRGCKRFAHEVIRWNSYTEGEKRIVDARLNQFLAQIVGSKFRIVDLPKLRSGLALQRVVYPAHKDPLLWVYELLRAGASQIVRPEEYGLLLDAQYRDVPLAELRTMIDSEFFILSQAHYDRYFTREIVRDRGKASNNEIAISDEVIMSATIK